MRQILLILGLTLQTICYGQLDHNNKILTLNKLQGTWIKEGDTLTTLEFNNNILVFKFGGGDWIQDSYDSSRIEISDTLPLIVRNTNMIKKNSKLTEYIISSRMHIDKIHLVCEIMQLTDKRMKLKYYPKGDIYNYYKKR